MLFLKKTYLFVCFERLSPRVTFQPPGAGAQALTPLSFAAINRHPFKDLGAEFSLSAKSFTNLRGLCGVKIENSTGSRMQFSPYSLP